MLFLAVAIPEQFLILFICKNFYRSDPFPMARGETKGKIVWHEAFVVQEFKKTTQTACISVLCVWCPVICITCIEFMYVVSGNVLQ